MSIKIFKVMLIIGLVFSFLPVIPVHAAVWTVCASGCDYTTIQLAINNAAAGDTINIGAGTFTPFIVDRQLTINGSGTGTIIAGASPVISVTAGGTSAVARQVISNLLVDSTGGSGNGIQLGAGVNFVTLDQVTATGNGGSGLIVLNTTDLIIQNSNFSNNGLGVRVGTTASLSQLLVTNSQFNNNRIGFITEQSSPTPGLFNNVTIQDSTFNNNTQKGMYFEKLSNAIIERVTVNGSGTDVAYAFNNGIDINLKYANYDNITLRDSLFTGSGIFTIAGTGGFSYASAIAIKARNDAPSYNANPATLGTITLSGLTIQNTNTGIRLGEPAKNNAGAANTIIEYTRFVNLSAQAIENTALSNVTAINNWWGCNTGPNTVPCANATATNGPITSNPWLTLTMLPVTCNGGTQTVTASLRVDAAGTTTGAPYLPDGIPVSFTTTSGSITAGATTTDGQASATWTAPAQTPATLTATVDNQTATLALTTTDCAVPTPVPVVESGTAPEVAAAPSPTYADSDYIIKSVDKTLAAIGDTLTFTISFGNPKGNTLNNVVIADTFDSRLSNVTLVSSSIGTPVINGNTLTLQGFSLAPGQRATLVITARISNSARAGDTISNTASLESPDASIHFSNVTLTTILPGSLPATGESALAGWRLPLLGLFIIVGLATMQRRRMKHTL